MKTVKACRAQGHCAEAWLNSAITKHTSDNQVSNYSFTVFFNRNMTSIYI